MPGYRAIWIEAAEMMDHIHYKWWKSGEMDLEQVQLELVDIFHFALSDMLEKTGTADDVAEKSHRRLECFLCHRHRTAAGCRGTGLARPLQVSAFAPTPLLPVHACCRYAAGGTVPPCMFARMCSTV